MPDQDSRLGMIIIIAALSIALIVVTVHWFMVQSKLALHSSPLSPVDIGRDYRQELITVCTLTASSTVTDRERCLMALKEVSGILAMYQSLVEVEPSAVVGGSASLAPRELVRDTAAVD